MTGRKEVDAAELRAAADELRALLREAHEALKDMDRLVDVYRRAATDAAAAGRKAAYDAATGEMARFSDHLQSEMNRSARELNAAVDRARMQVVESVRPIAVSIDSDTGRIEVQFAGGKFDAEIPLLADLAEEGAT